MSENIVSKTAVVANITEISTKQLCEFSDKHILRLSGRPQPFLEYSPETKPETPANATAADTKAVADRVILPKPRKSEYRQRGAKKTAAPDRVCRVQEQSAAVKLCP